MTEMEPIENIVKRDRIAASRRPELKKPTGGLNQIGNHVYIYSGQLDDVNGVYTTGLSFTTNTSYIFGEFQFDPAIKISEIATGDISVFKILLNDTPVSITKLDGGQEDMPSENTVRMILPPYTKVEVKYHGGADSADYPCFLRFIGETFNA